MEFSRLRFVIILFGTIKINGKNLLDKANQITYFCIDFVYSILLKLSARRAFNARDIPTNTDSGDSGD